MQTDCVILGGGAAGLCAAAALGRSGLRVTLLEKLPRVGKKLLATGNGRCNLSNTDMQPAYYGDSAPFVRKVYEATPPQEVSDFFTSLGLMTAVEDGRIYPRTMAASSVLDVSGRPFLVFSAPFRNERVGAFDTCLTEEFFRALCMNAAITLHLQVAYGANDHHMIEAAFKAFAHSLRMAATPLRNGKILSSKGVL